MDRQYGIGARNDPWVGWLSAVVLGLTLAYAINGLPEFDRDRVVATDYVNPLNRWIWLGLLALAAPVLLRRWREALALTLASWPLLLLYLYFALSAFWALDPAISARRMVFTLVQLALLIVLLSGLRRAVLAHLLIMGVCIGAALIDVGAWAALPGYVMTDEGFAGLQTQKNQTGLMMMFGCLSVGTGYFLRREWWWRVGVLGSLLMIAGLLVATRSTTSQAITLLAPAVMPVVLLVARLPRRVIWGIVLGVLAALSVAALLWVAVVDLAGGDPWGPMRGVTFTSRTDLWSFVLDEIAKRPWFGAGYASFWSIDPAVQPSLKADQWFSVFVLINEGHQGYLDLLATGGIFGFVGGMTVVLRTLCIAGLAITRASPAALAWRDGTLTRPTAVFHLTLLVCLLVHNFTESNLFFNNSVLAVAFVLAALELERWRMGWRAAAAPAVPHVTRPRPARAAAAAAPRPSGQSA